MPAPIAVFAFNRPEHLKKCLAALSGNDLAQESELTIFCDGPRNEREKEITDKVRQVAKDTTGFSSLSVIENDSNFGCANAVFNGLKSMFAVHEQLIVVEDDIICSPYTLLYLNIALARYEQERAVFNISAWSPPSIVLQIPDSYPYGGYFIPRFNCWGWASWRDRYKLVEWDISDYSEFLNNHLLHEVFNRGGFDLTAMLEQQMSMPERSTWDVFFDYARFKHGLVGFNPVCSYTTNIGTDGSGTHYTFSDTRFDNDISLVRRDIRWPIHIFVDRKIETLYQAVYKIQPSARTIGLFRQKLAAKQT